MNKAILCCLLFFSATTYAQTDCLPNSDCRVLRTGNGISTSSHFDHTNTAAVVGAEVGTAATLTYLFEVRPELQRLHNEKINAIEGQFADEYSELNELVASSIPMLKSDQAQTTVRGYSLGESWASFVSTSPHLQANIAKCERHAAPKQSRKHQVYDPCADVRYMGSDGSGTIVFDCVFSNMATDEMCRDFNGEVTFVDGKLSALKIILPNVTLTDAVAKFGPPSGTDNDGTSEVWHGAQYDVAADKMDEGIALIWENPTQSAATVNAQQQLVKATVMQETQTANANF